MIVRILYVVFEAFLNTGSFNVRTGGTVTEKAVLDVLPEFILVLALLAVGFASRNLKHERQAAEQSTDRQYRGSSGGPVAVEEAQMYRK